MEIHDDAWYGIIGELKNETEGLIWRCRRLCLEDECIRMWASPLQTLKAVSESRPIVTRLSDVLEENVPDKYYLSDEATERLLRNGLHVQRLTRTTSKVSTIMEHEQA